MPWMSASSLSSSVKNSAWGALGFSVVALAPCLHDVGQMRLPRNVVLKAGRYTDGEQRLMQAHPQLGLTLLDRSGNFPEEARRIIAEHHERADGSGYPGRADENANGGVEPDRGDH